MLQIRRGLLARTLPVLVRCCGRPCHDGSINQLLSFVHNRKIQSHAANVAPEALVEGGASRKAQIICVNCQVQDKESWFSKASTAEGLCYPCFVYAQRNSGSPRPPSYERRRQTRPVTPTEKKGVLRVECVNCHTTQSGTWHYEDRTGKSKLCHACFQYQFLHGTQRPLALIERSKRPKPTGPCVHCNAQTTRRWCWNDDLAGWICYADDRFLKRHRVLPTRVRPSDMNAKGRPKVVTKLPLKGPCKHCEATDSPQWHYNESMSGPVCDADQIYWKKHGRLPERTAPSDVTRAHGPCVHCKVESSVAWRWNDDLQGAICNADYLYLRLHGRLAHRLRPSGPCTHCNAVTSTHWRWNDGLRGYICNADNAYLRVHGRLPHRSRPSDVRKGTNTKSIEPRAIYQG